MKSFMTGLDKGDLLIYRWLLNRGDLMGRFDCIYINICDTI